MLQATSPPPPVLFRTESYSGSGVRDLPAIIEFEVTALRNTDIPAYIAAHYELPPDVRQELDDMLALADDGEYPFGFNHDRTSLMDVFRRALDAIAKQTGVHPRYGLWLADRQEVIDHYLQDGDIQAYETSPVILSDLGPDGILFAYEHRPQPITDTRAYENTPRLRAAWRRLCRAYDDDTYTLADDERPCLIRRPLPEPSYRAFHVHSLQYLQAGVFRNGFRVLGHYENGPSDCLFFTNDAPLQQMYLSAPPPLRKKIQMHY